MSLREWCLNFSLMRQVITQQPSPMSDDFLRRADISAMLDTDASRKRWRDMNLDGLFGLWTRWENAGDRETDFWREAIIMSSSCRAGGAYESEAFPLLLILANAEQHEPGVDLVVRWWLKHQVSRCGISIFIREIADLQYGTA